MQKTGSVLIKDDSTRTTSPIFAVSATGVSSMLWKVSSSAITNNRSKMEKENKITKCSDRQRILYNNLSNIFLIGQKQSCPRWSCIVLRILNPGLSVSLLFAYHVDWSSMLDNTIPFHSRDWWFPLKNTIKKEKIVRHTSIAGSASTGWNTKLRKYSKLSLCKNV